MPRTGKTTQIKRLRDYLASKGLTFELITDRDFIDKVKTPIEQTFLYNQEFFGLMCEEAKKKIASNPDFLIYDRGFYDQLVWSTDDVLLGNCTQVQKEEFDHKLDSYRDESAALIQLVAPKVMRDERHVAAGEFTQIDAVVMEDYFLKKLEESYQITKEIVFSKHPNYLEINSSQKEEAIFAQIIDFLTEKKVLVP